MKGSKISMNDITDLASATINGTDLITVQLIRPRMPATERTLKPTVVRIVWPSQPSIVEARTYGETAAALTKLFAESAMALAGIKARKRPL
jgi:hypothetical protein